MRAYKANLGLLNNRFGDLERRVLERFVKEPGLTEVVIDRSHEVLLGYLIRDGLLVDLGPADGALRVEIAAGDDGATEERYFGPARWALTAEGLVMVKHLRRAERLE